MPVQTDTDDSLEESDIFHILGNDRRRAIVQHLSGETNQINVSDVATWIAERESDSSAVPNNLYKSVYVSLQQTHLPQLEEDGVIEYDPTAKTIGAGPQFETVQGYIDGEHNRQETTLWIHLGICAIGLVLITLVGLEFPGIASIDPIVTSVVVMVAIAASSLYTLYQ